MATTRTETQYVPTCGTASPTNPGELCLGATTTCPDPDAIRFWIFRRTIDLRIPGDDPPFVLLTTPPFVCLQPDDPALDPTVAIPAIVEREFQRVVVLKGVAKVNPAPDTLVNLATRFQTTSTDAYDIPLTILGHAVVITATARSWTWTFGDGHTAATAAPGRHGYLEHTYDDTGTRTARVDITWTGTWTLDDGPARTIIGTVTTTGQPAQVTVKQARAKLVGG